MDDKQVFSLAASSFNAVADKIDVTEDIDGLIELAEQLTVARIELVTELIEAHAEAPKETRSRSGGRSRNGGRGGNSRRSSGRSSSSQKVSEKQADLFEDLVERLGDDADSILEKKKYGVEDRDDFFELGKSKASDLIGDLIDKAEDLGV